MRRSYRLIAAALLFSTLTLLGVVGHEFRLFERGWFNLKAWWQPSEQGIGLTAIG